MIRIIYLRFFHTLFLFMMFCSVVGLSEKVRASGILALGVNSVFELAADGRTMEQRQPLSLRGGYRFSYADIFLEYTNFRVSQGTTAVYLSREHQEAVIWMKRYVNSEWLFSPSFAIGLGAQNDRVDTVLRAQTSTDVGAWQPMTAATVGLRAFILDQFTVELEARVSASSENKPNPLYGLGLLMGFCF